MAATLNIPGSSRPSVVGGSAFPATRVGHQRGGDLREPARASDSHGESFLAQAVGSTRRRPSITAPAGQPLSCCVLASLPPRAVAALPCLPGPLSPFPPSPTRPEPSVSLLQQSLPSPSIPGAASRYRLTSAGGVHFSSGWHLPGPKTSKAVRLAVSPSLRPVSPQSGTRFGSPVAPVDPARLLRLAPPSGSRGPRPKNARPRPRELGPSLCGCPD
jgi:hypothetical protein